MKMNVEDTDGIKVVFLDGKLDSNSVGVINDDMVKLAQENEKIVINLKGLQYISSAGLRILLLAGKLIKNHRQGKMSLCEANEFVENVLEVSGFHSLLNHFNTQEEALKFLE